MSVVGIIILVSLLLILKLLVQVTLAVAETVPEVSEAELNDRIESLEQTRREIQDEFARLNRMRQESIPDVPSQDQMESVQTSIERLDDEIIKLEETLKKSRQRRDDLNNRPDATIMKELEENIRKLKELLDKLREKNAELAKRQRTLQATLDDLTKQQADLDRQLSEHAVQKVYAIPSSSTNKTPYLLIYGQGTMTVLSQADPTGQSFTSVKAFYDWVAGRNKKTEYIVLYVRPSRFGKYEEILDELRRMGFDVGLQVIGEETEIALQ